MDTKKLVKISLLAILTFFSGMIQIPIGPVPITMQTVFVNLSAIVLGPLDAAISMFVHLLLKIIVGGPGILAKPSSGFLIGFIIAAYIGSAYYRYGPRTNRTLIISLIITSLVPYIIGLPTMAIILKYVNGMDIDPAYIMKAGFLVFIPGDLLKLFISYLVAKRISPVHES